MVHHDCLFLLPVVLNGEYLYSEAFNGRTKVKFLFQTHLLHVKSLLLVGLEHLELYSCSRVKSIAHKRSLKS